MKSPMIRRRIRRPLLLVLLAAGLVLLASEYNRAQDAGSGRQPTISDQFTTVSSGALQSRRPGLFVQQAIAVNSGSGEFLDGAPIDQPRSFLGQVWRDMLLGIIDIFNNLLTAINPNSSLTDLIGLTGLPDLTGTNNPLSNPLTSGSGGSTPIQ